MNSRDHISKLIADFADMEKAAAADREAVRHLEPAAKQGDAEAQVKLGTFYEWGRGGLLKDGRERHACTGSLPTKEMQTGR